ncbi:sugar phosphate isomerase/epimerase family protein [Paenibacillus chartarius]|uniref:Sugar phosphate isomerase/epimerase family protein n=1 Tax=Paenibacillus chartarius TaxID=747481 RepID=A0ABV6DLZ1_9BACL
MIRSEHLSLSTWSLHRLLGPLRWTIWDDASRTPAIREEFQPAEMELLELPAVLAQRGFRFLEVCHFHFPATEEAYVKKLKAAFEASGVIFHTLLVDYGDISSPDEGRREADIRYLQGWIDVAAQAGARAVRIVAGEQPAGDAAAIARSCEALRSLDAYASAQGVRIVTENFRSLTSTISSWSAVLVGFGQKQATIVDFGNLTEEEKEAGIAFGAPQAHSIHAKPDYLADGSIDTESFGRLLDIVKSSGCEAPVSIIFDRPGNMWEGIEAIRAVMVR